MLLFMLDQFIYILYDKFEDYSVACHTADKVFDNFFTLTSFRQLSVGFRYVASGESECKDVRGKVVICRKANMELVISASPTVLAF